MLPVIAILLVVVYIILDRSGALADLGASVRRRGDDRSTGHPEIEDQAQPDPEVDRRLEIFEEFITGLDSDEGDDEET